jgi:hypothetical protein
MVKVLRADASDSTALDLALLAQQHRRESMPDVWPDDLPPG